MGIESAIVLAVGALLLHLYLRSPLRKVITSRNRLLELIRILLYRGLDGARLELFAPEGTRIGVVRKIIVATDDVHLEWSATDGVIGSFDDPYDAACAIADSITAGNGLSERDGYYGYLYEIHTNNVRIGFSS